jgi:hypothetical protein
MADVTLGRFPDGAEVGAYPVSNWPAHKRDHPSGEPLGTASATETADNGVTFTGLDDGQYWAAAEVADGEWRYIRFYAGQDDADPSRSVLRESLSQWVPIFRASTGITTAATSGNKYLVIPAQADSPSTAITGTPLRQLALINLDPADAPGGFKSRLRLRMAIGAGSTAPAVTYDAGLYTYGLSANTLTANTIVSGSAVSIANPASGGFATASGSGFDCPAAGLYLFAMTVSGTPAATASPQVSLWRQFVPSG